jgi:uncharacterized membrane protein YphA (DoxX/SURF4 family)
MAAEIASSSSSPIAGDGVTDWAIPRWKALGSHISAVVIGILFLVSGIWKITDPLGWTIKVEQFKVPYELSLAFTLALAISETWGGLMILVPAFRRWGAWLCALLLIGFMVYMGIHYSEFKNMDCTCFPLLKRAIGPEFFIGDAVMLALVALAGWWAPQFQPTHGRGRAGCGGRVLGRLLWCGGIADFRHLRTGIDHRRRPALCSHARPRVLVLL